MRKLILTAALLFALRLSAFAATIPILTISKATLDYGNNQVMFYGSGFEPARKAPTVLFAGAQLTVISYTDAQIVAALPANTAAGDFTILMVNSLGEFLPYELTCGAMGPQGPETRRHGEQVNGQTVANSLRDGRSSMKSFSLALGLAMVLTSALPTTVLAQQKPGNLILIGELTPKPAAVQPFEQGLKQLAAWHESIKDPQSRAVFQQITGEKRGTYLIVLRGMHWADLDRPIPSDEQAQTEFSKAMGDTVASHAVRAYEEIPRLSHTGSPARNRPAKYYEIDTFHVPLGKQDRFAAAVARFREAFEKTKAPGDFICSALSEGGQFGTWELAFGHDTAADFDGPPPDEILKNAFGRAEADSIVRDFSDLTGGFFTEEVVQFRSDLSYFPPDSK